MKPSPSSVPESYENELTTIGVVIKSPFPSTRDTFLTPVNQSGLGAIIVMMLTNGFSALTLNVRVLPFGETAGELKGELSMIRNSASSAVILVLISDLNSLVVPFSATFFIPVVARTPDCQMLF